MVWILLKMVFKDDVEVFGNFGIELKWVVYGQDLVIEILLLVIKLVWVGLCELDKLIGSYLFFGLIGVGKIEVVCQLVFFLGVELIWFDMLEYMEWYMVFCLIGVFLGYVGFDQGGFLIDGVDQYLYCVLLFDEIEKVYLDLFNILLQVMDYGKLMDYNGKQVDFCNVILIMIINVGVVDMVKMLVGFNCVKWEGDDQEVINKLFILEFCNCFDVIILFGNLLMEVVYKVVEKFVMQLEVQLVD